MAIRAQTLIHQYTFTLITNRQKIHKDKISLQKYFCKISFSLRGNTSKNNGDLYLFNFSYSFRTENKSKL